MLVAAVAVVAWGAQSRFPPGKNPPGCTIVDSDPEEFRGKPTVGITKEMKLEILRRKRAAGAPELPDLDVTYIERTPRFPRYDVQYHPRGRNPHLSEREQHLQRWPNDGQMVTFHAHIANKGLRRCPPSKYMLLIDDRPLRGGAGRIPAMGPCEEVVAHAEWPWRSGRHTVTVRVDTAGAIKEISEENNAITDFTDAYTFFWTVRDRAHVAQDCVRNRYGSYSSEDWHRSVMEWMNESFARCKYPTTPEGIPARVRIDYYWVHPRPWEVHNTNVLNRLHDGTWPHCVGGKPRKGESPAAHAKRSEQAPIEYAEKNALYDPFRPGGDGGLVHELGHQLGLIDLYHMNVPGRLCSVRMADGRLLREVLPDKANQKTWIKGIMVGGRAPLGWSEHSANALVRDYCRRRGFYGDYLMDLPERSFVRVLDGNGNPIAGAGVKVYQRNGENVPDVVKHQGRTDRSGLFDLGGQLFGTVHVVGKNGSLLFRVEHPGTGTVDWVWLGIIDFNLARWRGQVKRAIIPLRTEL